jgi:oligopeptide/dipeptide ABC transporter ATP-binding protein
MSDSAEGIRVTRTVDEVLLRVIGLQTYFFVRRGVVKAVNGVNFFLRRGEVLGLVGESGCGKSVTGLSILRLVIDPPGKIVGGQIFLEGEDLLLKSEKEMREIRGKKITMVQQNPDTSLNPVFRIGEQVGEAIAIHQRLGKKALRDRIVELLRLVKIPSPEVRMLDYPHQMSGGMRQRVAGAVALSCEASLLIADEPTTSLDVTTQMEYLELLEEIQDKTGMAIMFITHDFGIVARICDRVAVMYAGRIVETAPTLEIMERPKHPYTIALLYSVPKPGSRGTKLRSIEGNPPDPVDLRPGCTFAPRCASRDRRCFKEHPSEVQIDKDHYVSCFHVGY